jgi:hypothetical protein
MRGLLEGQSISCSFIAAAGSPKAVCWVGDTDVTQWLLSQGWAERAEGVTDESYVEAAASTRRRNALRMAKFPMIGCWKFTSRIQSSAIISSASAANVFCRISRVLKRLLSRVGPISRMARNEIKHDGFRIVARKNGAGEAL